MGKIIKLDIPEGYEFCGIESDYRKILIRKKQIEYPKTFKECSSVINEKSAFSIGGYKGIRLYELQCLLICRDAYWKVYADNEGLDKPWQPDWTDTNEQKYNIYCVANELKMQPSCELQHVLAFPTREMCGAFYNNFKTLIESCKDLL
jgi:hypothetical protein